MIRVIIGDSERELSSIDADWINQQVNRRRADGQAVCVKAIIKADQLDMILTSAGCLQGAIGGGRRPNRYEQEIFDLWEKRGLNEENFHGGNLVAFLKQLRI